MKLEGKRRQRRMPEKVTVADNLLSMLDAAWCCEQLLSWCDGYVIMLGQSQLRQRRERKKEESRRRTDLFRYAEGNRRCSWFFSNDTWGGQSRQSISVKERSNHCGFPAGTYLCTLFVGCAGPVTWSYVGLPENKLDNAKYWQSMRDELKRGPGGLCNNGLKTGDNKRAPEEKSWNEMIWYGKPMIEPHTGIRSWLSIRSQPSPADGRTFSRYLCRLRRAVILSLLWRYSRP